jgi:hypothetical protein
MGAIDIVIPCIGKDVANLPLVIDSAISKIRNTIGKIFVIGPDDSIIRSVAEECKAIWLDEASVVGIPISSIDYYPEGRDRRGWLYQQLIKLSADTLGDSEYLLLLDSDTIFIRDIVFTSAGKVLVHFSDEYHEPYYATLKRLLPKLQKHFHHSFVCHQFCISRKHLHEVKEAIEKESGLDWKTAIMKSIDKNEFSSFSEYETLGNFMMANHASEVVLEHFLNYSTDRNIWDKHVLLRRIAPMLYKSVSFHSYNQVKS